MIADRADASDERFMSEALALAQSAAEQGEVPVGAVLVVGGDAVAREANAPISRSDPTAHAEILVLRAAGERIGNYRLPGATLYVTLEPCPMCAAAMVHARIERLVYGAADPKTGAAGSVFDLARDARLNHRIVVDGGVLADEAVRLLRDFFRGRRERS
ncbi:MAG TPA: tRNA adenosine(34) deaminase TadA [Gammaproteobacteria bacterium]|nr:tRNA adenosine(34) deaminase TadA [Gammaproteobacteria bacterium]